MRVVNNYVQKGVKIMIEKTEDASSKLVTQDIRKVTEQEKLQSLVSLIKSNLREKVLIFVETKYKCD